MHILMNDTDIIAPLRPTPRKRDSDATRTAILEAAKAHFAGLGYDSAILRGIAGDAGVDVALVKRYFGGKEALFLEALKSSFGPDSAKEWDRATFAFDTATMLAGSPHRNVERTQRFQFLLRAATSPTTAPLLNLLVQGRFLGPIRQWLGGAESEARARVFAAVYIGCLVERLVRGEALAGRERDIFIQRVAAIFASLIAEPD